MRATIDPNLPAFWKTCCALAITLVVWKLDRLARSRKKRIATAGELEGEKIGLVSLTESIDTTTPGGMPTFHVFGAIAQFERALIRERTTAGLIEARIDSIGLLGSTGSYSRKKRTPLVWRTDWDDDRDSSRLPKRMM